MAQTSAAVSLDLIASMDTNLFVRMLALHRDEPFSDHLLQETLYTLISKYNFLLQHTTPSSDGTPNHGTPLEAAVNTMISGSVIYLRDSQLQLSGSGRAFAQRHLTQKYGEHVLDITKPFADEVWKAYAQMDI